MTDETRKRAAWMLRYGSPTTGEVRWLITTLLRALDESAAARAVAKVCMEHVICPLCQGDFDGHGDISDDEPCPVPVFVAAYERTREAK
jgi:carboxylesterase type B